MRYDEIKSKFRALNDTYPLDTLTAHIVFTKDSFKTDYPLLSRTYAVSSDNKAFRNSAGGYSIFGYCLDLDSDQGVRLECYMADEGNENGWTVQDCYILEHMPDADAVPDAVREPMDGGTVRYTFGNTVIDVTETHDGDKIHLVPTGGCQDAGNGRTGLPMDRVYGYCTLLERDINHSGERRPYVVRIQGVYTKSVVIWAKTQASACEMAEDLAENGTIVPDKPDSESLSVRGKGLAYRDRLSELDQYGDVPDRKTVVLNRK